MNEFVQLKQIEIFVAPYKGIDYSGILNKSVCHSDESVAKGQQIHETEFCIEMKFHLNQFNSEETDEGESKPPLEVRGQTHWLVVFMFLSTVIKLLFPHSLWDSKNYLKVVKNWVLSIG